MADPVRPGKGRKTASEGAASAGNAARGTLTAVAEALPAMLGETGGRLSEESAAARDYRTRAKAADTLRADTGDRGQFEGWCDERGLDPPSARP